jgi:hypothetical protein
MQDSNSPQAWARWAGALYLATNAAAIFAFVARGRLVAKGDPVQTVANIAASETLFRASIAGELLSVMGTIALTVALYAVLRPVARDLALLAAFWRLAENCVLACVALTSLAVLALLKTADGTALAYAFLQVHNWGFQIGFLFLGIGSALFSWLWWQSRLIPRAFAAWGMFASLLMAAVALLLIVRPDMLATITLYYMAPMGLYEIGLGLWLLFVGIRRPA